MLVDDRLFDLYVKTGIQFVVEGWKTNTWEYNNFFGLDSYMAQKSYFRVRYYKALSTLDIYFRLEVERYLSVKFGRGLTLHC